LRKQTFAFEKEMGMKKTTDNHQVTLARNEQVVVRELTDEVLVYDLTRHRAHCLNRTAAFVWNHCDGETTVNEIARLMGEEWDTPVSEDIVWFALDKLGKADLLQERIKMPQAGMSRRSAVRQMGLGALLAIPVVMSVVSPTPAAAASVPVVCQACRKKSDGICPPTCDENVLGTCYDNAGCGAGQALYCSTCTACFSDPNLTETISWKAPGDLC
jgi:hypothetical protein